jgi:hypothetical protein
MGAGEVVYVDNNKASLAACVKIMRELQDKPHVFKDIFTATAMQVMVMEEVLNVQQVLRTADPQHNLTLLNAMRDWRAGVKGA